MIRAGVEAEMTIRRGIWFAAIAASALAAGWAQAQTPDPLAPGAANDIVAPEPGAKPEAAKPSAAPSAASESKPEKHRPKPKPKEREPKESERETGGTLAVTVNNKRAVGLVDLTVGPAGGDNPKKVAGPLAFGRKTVIHIKRAKDCLYDVRGHFADDADTEQLGVELCKDKVINLTDD
jgi:hypothetical protein